MSPLLLSICFLCLPLCIKAQADSTREEVFIRCNAVSILAGFAGNEYREHQQQDIQRIVPGNSLAFADLSNAVRINSIHGSGNARWNIGLQVHFKTKDLKTSFTRFSSEWRAGIFLAAMTPERILYSEKISVPADTFYSQQTGMVFTEGGNYTLYHKYSYESNNVYADISKTYHSDQRKRLSVYAGLNFGFGTTYQDKLLAVRSQGYGTEPNRRIRWGDVGYDEDAVHENSSLPASYFFTATLPLGVSWRLVSTKRDLAKKLAFSIEGRFGYRFEKRYTSYFERTWMGSVQAGIKYYFRNETTK